MIAARPRVLVRGGVVHTPENPRATAMLTVGGTVVWLGDEAGAATYGDSVDEVIDLQGRLVTPGFVDAHVHLSETGFALQSTPLGEATSLQDALDRLATTTNGGRVVFAHGWDESGWPERRPPTMTEVDRAVDGAVALLGRVDGHSAVVSTALLAMRPEIKAMDGWSDGGWVAREAHHAAVEVLQGLRTAETSRAALLTALHSAAAHGLVSVHELNAPHISPWEDLQILRELAAEQPLPEVVPYWGAMLGGDHAEDSVQGFAGDLCVDGAIGSRTARLHEPYADEDARGHQYLDAEQICRHVLWCTRRQTQAGFHVIGDAAMTEVVRGLQLAEQEVGAPSLLRCRHRLEHAEMPDPEALATLARLGVVASVQPAFEATWGGRAGMYTQRLGPARSAAMNPYASMERSGVTLAFGSDSPVTPMSPWAAIRAAVHHHVSGQRLTVEEAFTAHTRGGHRARGDDHSGTLVPGAAATYAVWSLPEGMSGDDRPGSSDAEAGPWLPTPAAHGPLPICVRTVRDGQVLYAAAD